MMAILITKANEVDAIIVSSILTEAAAWLDSIGQPLWGSNELLPECIISDIKLGLYYLCWSGRHAIGTFKFQLEDKTIWPDVSQDDSAFLHRIAIKRSFAGEGVSAAIINWAKTHTKDIGRKFLRIDCELRPKLCRIYENQGFVKHSEKDVGPWHVVRYEYDL